MRKLKDIEIFSQEEGAFTKFVVYLAIFFAIDFFADFIIKKIYLKESFEWGEYVLTYLIFAAVLTMIYFVTRLLAYRTKIFPKIENREGLHGVSFIFLLVLSFVLVFVII